MNPVENTTYREVLSFLKKTGLRLPTSDEWTQAQQGGTDGKFYWGDQRKSAAHDHSWYKKNSYNRHHRVKLKKPNAYGLYDISGNLLERVEHRDPKRKATLRYSKGGYYDGDYQRMGNSWIFWSDVNSRNIHTGFRPVYSP